MRLHKIIFVLFIAFVLNEPFSAKAQVPPSREIRSAEIMEQARRFVHEYTARFMKLDLDPFMELFSRIAVENRELPYDDIREAYRKTIEGSRSVEYRLDIDTIQTQARSVLVAGRYRIIQAFKKGGKTVLSGNIQWDLIREGGSLKIRELNYGRDR
jgi:hypothetical protein